MKCKVVSDGTPEGTRLVDGRGRVIDLRVRKIEWMIDAEDIAVMRLYVPAAEIEAKAGLVAIIQEDDS